LPFWSTRVHPRVLRGVCNVQSLVFCVVFWAPLFAFFVLFSLATAIPVLLRILNIKHANRIKKFNSNTNKNNTIHLFHWQSKKSEECLSFDVYNNLTLFIVKYDHNPCQLKQRTRSQQQTHCNSRNITEMTKLNTTNTKPGEVNVSS
jgi:hypothetical protein